MEHLLSVWSKISEQISEARHILLLADYDGTLTPIVDKPEIANLSEDMRGLLNNLSRKHFFTLGIISGRALSDIKEKVRIANIIYAGNHGLEIEGRGIKFLNPIANELTPIFNIIYILLNTALETFKGVYIENKGLSLSVHYRLADESISEEVQNIMERLIGGLIALGKIKITPGKKVYEVRPAVTWDKGKATKYLMKRYGRGGRTSGLFAIYLGDDLTDEDGFKVINDYRIGLSVFVGEPNRQSSAQYFLKSPAEVAEFFKMLLTDTKFKFSI